jgi:hypothetical protein
MNFDEKPVMNLAEAQLAGVKRLLKDNGYKIARIDGRPDQSTGAALADFGNGSVPMPAMPNCSPPCERGAREKAAPAGYTVCNESRDVLLVALGPDGAGQAVSARLVDGAAGRLRQDRDRALEDQCGLSAGTEEGWRPRGDRAKNLLTTPVIFEITGAQNCAARGLTESGFAVTATKGVTGYVAHIGPDGLKAPAPEAQLSASHPRQRADA